MRLASTPAEIEQDIGAFIRLHHARWDPRGGSDALDEGVERMLHEIAQELVASGRLRLASVATADANGGRPGDRRRRRRGELLARVASTTTGREASRRSSHCWPRWRTCSRARTSGSTWVAGRRTTSSASPTDRTCSSGRASRRAARVAARLVAACAFARPRRARARDVRAARRAAPAAQPRRLRRRLIPPPTGRRRRRCALATRSSRAHIGPVRGAGAAVEEPSARAARRGHQVGLEPAVADAHAVGLGCARGLLERHRVPRRREVHAGGERQRERAVEARVHVDQAPAAGRVEELKLGEAPVARGREQRRGTPRPAPRRARR